MTPWDHFLTGFAVCVVCTLGVAVVGHFLLGAIGEGSVARRVHGRYVYRWAVVGVAASGPLLPFADPDVGAFFGWPMFCLLAGWLVGTIHGGLVLGVRTLRRLTPDGRRPSGR